MPFKNKKRPNVDIVRGPRVCLVDKWEAWHESHKQFQSKYNINDPSRCMGEGDEEFADEVEKHWNQWLCISQVEIASNFGVTNSEERECFCVQ